MFTQSMPQANITLIDAGSGNGQRWLIGDNAAYTLGRVTGTDITLPYSWVSRKHAMIQREHNGRFNLIDLGSSNGTFVNGRQIHTPVTLQNGDCIGIGSTRLLFSQDTLPARSASSGADLEEMTVALVQKQEITILICDITGYTRLAETLGDFLLSQVLQHWTGGVSKLVQKRDGIIDKFIGDAVMAIWAGQDSRKNIHQALAAALDINLFTNNLGRKIPNLPAPLRIGAALNTGEAMTGNLAQGGQGNYTVVGDMVNVAFRLESLTNSDEGLDLIFGCDAAIHLDSPETFCRKYSFQLKGKQEAVEAYACSFSQLSSYLAQQGLNTPV